MRGTASRFPGVSPEDTSASLEQHGETQQEFCRLNQARLSQVGTGTLPPHEDALREASQTLTRPAVIQVPIT